MKKATQITTQVRAQLLDAFWEAPAEALFDQRTIAVVRGCSEAALERERWAGGGIPYLKIGRLCRYRKRITVDWLNEKAVCLSTSEYRQPQAASGSQP